MRHFLRVLAFILILVFESISSAKGLDLGVKKNDEVAVSQWPRHHKHHAGSTPSIAAHVDATASARMAAITANKIVQHSKVSAGDARKRLNAFQKMHMKTQGLRNKQISGKQKMQEGLDKISLHHAGVAVKLEKGKNEADHKSVSKKEGTDAQRDRLEAKQDEKSTLVREKRIDVDTEMPYTQMEPFGREDTAQELTESSIRESNKMVDQVERAEVAETKRAIFRALSRLRGAAIASFDGIAGSQTGNIDNYSQVHHWLSSHPVHHLANEESDASKWAFSDVHHLAIPDD